jgi:threonine synthase
VATITHFECTRCGERVDARGPQTLCPKDAGVLYVRYDFGKNVAKPQGNDASMWRYRAVLPDAKPVTLGEGFTPLLPSRKNANVLIKDEGMNPTGSFKARGLGMAVTMAKHFGLKKLAIPSAGNAAGALAAYCAAAGIECFIFMPKDVPQANLVECKSYGAHVELINGLIGDCARVIGERKEREGWFDISTLKEPFRVEGKKTMGYEVAEQLGWTLPDAIIYPTGGGVGMIGMWKAFEEMEQLGWIPRGKRPKMITVQAENCAPIVKAFDQGKAASEPWPEAETVAAGLRVPKAYGDYILLDILKQSHGTAVAASDAEMIGAVRGWASDEGVFAAPEGAACLVAYNKLRALGFLRESDRVVLFNTGSGLKYIDVIANAAGMNARPLPASRNIGGIIQPN